MKTWFQVWRGNKSWRRDYTCTSAHTSPTSLGRNKYKALCMCLFVCLSVCCTAKYGNRMNAYAHNQPPGSAAKVTKISRGDLTITEDVGASMAMSGSIRRTPARIKHDRQWPPAAELAGRQPEAHGECQTANSHEGSDNRDTPHRQGPHGDRNHHKATVMEILLPSPSYRGWRLHQGMQSALKKAKGNQLQHHTLVSPMCGYPFQRLHVDLVGPLNLRRRNWSKNWSTVRVS